MNMLKWLKKNNYVLLGLLLVIISPIILNIILLIDIGLLIVGSIDGWWHTQVL